MICPCVEVEPATEKALADTGWKWSRAYVGHSEEAYWEVLSRLWRIGETFCVVEHDVIVRPDSLSELAQCSSDWCSFEVPYGCGIYAGLSCAKFSAALIARHPDTLEKVGERSDEGHLPKHWCRLDSWLQVVLREKGESMCVHSPPLGHRESVAGYIASSHGC